MRQEIVETARSADWIDKTLSKIPSTSDALVDIVDSLSCHVNSRGHIDYWVGVKFNLSVPVYLTRLSESFTFTSALEMLSAIQSEETKLYDVWEKLGAIKGVASNVK